MGQKKGHVVAERSMDTQVPAMTVGRRHDAHPPNANEVTDGVAHASRNSRHDQSIRDAADFDVEGAADEHAVGNVAFRRGATHRSTLAQAVETLQQSRESLP